MPLPEAARQEPIAASAAGLLELRPQIIEEL